MGASPDPTSWRRICVIGCCGAGKSTLARALGVLLQIPVVHLDDHYWRPGWQPADPAAFRTRVAELAAADRWILDGNYAGTLDLRLPKADLSRTGWYAPSACPLEPGGVIRTRITDVRCSIGA